MSAEINSLNPVCGSCFGDLVIDEHGIVCSNCNMRVVEKLTQNSISVGDNMNDKRGNVLLEAHDIINGERQQQYGSPEDSHEVIAKLWSGYVQASWQVRGVHKITAHDVAHMMVLFKIARELNGAGKRDNYRDAAGYLAIASDMAVQNG